MTFDLDQVISDLDYAQGDLVGRSSRPVAPSRRQAWRAAKDRLAVDAAFFEGGVPLVYFRGLDLPSTEAVDAATRLFHHRAWSQSSASFLVVVTPTEVRILDGRTPWNRGPELGRASSGQAIRDVLAMFARRSILSGEARSMLRPAQRRSVVTVLRESLSVSATRLVETGLSRDAAHALLGRSMYLQYLQDRHLLERLTATATSVSDFSEALEGKGGAEGDTAAVYDLFAAVYERLNGDVFPVTREERRAVGSEHLMVVADFLRGRPDGQLDLFPLYDFSVVPAELLSNVYEEFIAHRQRESGAYYTPERIADLVLDEVFPQSGSAPIRVLDPACGSGTFLARAYRRCIEASEADQGRRLSPSELSELLSASIFGCDLLESATRVAALSCYLVLLDYCTDDEVSAGVRLPAMHECNLFTGDFFELEARLAGPWDVIATNPPWRSHMSVAARGFVERHGAHIGDEQVAQAFYVASVERLAPDGRAGLLMPAKSLFNQSRTNQRFRQTALADTNLDLIVDFSPFRRELFQGSVAPMAMMVVRGGGVSRREHLTFCTPRRSPVSETLDRIVVSGSEIKRVPRNLAAMSPRYLKAAQAGGTRDADLLEGLRRRFPSLGSLESEHGWRIGSGYQLGTAATRVAPWLTGARKIPADAIDILRVTSAPDLKETAERFRRAPRPELFDPPLVLVSRTIRGGHVHAASVDEHVAYSASVVGIGPAHLEEASLVAGFLSSSLARYLLFLTSTTWGVERSALDPQDLRALPIAMPTCNSTERADLLSIVHDRRVHDAATGCNDALDEAVFKAYRLSRIERIQVVDTLLYALDRHESDSAAPAFAAPTEDQLGAYRATLERGLAVATGCTVRAVVDVGRPYTAVRIGLDGRVPSNEYAPDVWATVDRAAQEHTETAVLLRRTVRRYDGHRIDMAKPSEARNFTRSAALEDVDEIVGDVLRAARPRVPTDAA